MQQDLRRPARQSLVDTAPRDPEAFIAWAYEREGRWELSADGVVTMQAGGSRYHGRIALNVAMALSRCLDPKQYHVSTTEVAVRIGRAVRYPDVLVDRLASQDDALKADAPVFLVEVLSPSSIDTDMIEKPSEYFGLKILGACLVCSRDEPRVWLWVKKRGRLPKVPLVIKGHDGAVELPHLDVTLPITDIYAGLPLKFSGA
jgi:Uma2 family endonuclease